MARPNESSPIPRRVAGLDQMSNTHSADDLDSLEETLDILSTPGALEEIQQARAAIARGEVYPLEQVKAEIARQRNETGAA
ncbi:MAG: hypothetical protein ACRD0K_05890 [Egibacteraceae bacterium]